MSFCATRPVTEAKEKKNKLQQMIDEGYEFAEESRRNYVLLDTPKNRELITKLVKGRFPSLSISKWENWCIHNKDDFQLRSFECIIRDLNELKSLIAEMEDYEEE
ncbi:hypothetical protein FDB23_03310 [Clostridium botulinum]|nr:hypothetical protein [Clostridium botulinum]